MTESRGWAHHANVPFIASTNCLGPQLRGTTLPRTRVNRGIKKAGPPLAKRRARPERRHEKARDGPEGGDDGSVPWPPFPLLVNTLRDKGASPHRPKGLEKGRKSAGTARRLGVADHDKDRGPTAPVRWGPQGGVGHRTRSPKRREGTRLRTPYTRTSENAPSTHSGE
jgi:hypothetical protein